MIRTNNNMQNCNYSDEFCASGDCPNDTSLTEKWEKGELPSADEKHTWLAYYLKQASGRIHADSYWRGNRGHADRNSIIKVLAPVPSYEEYLSLTYAKEEDEKIIAEYEKETQQLKELLKECNNELKILRMLSLPMASKEALSECEELLTKIDNAIGEK